jgi:excisionase family DNA binding protein
MSTPAPQRPDDLLTIAEVAAALRVSYSTLYRWEAAGRIQVERTPTGQRRYRRHAVDSVLRSAA